MYAPRNYRTRQENNIPLPLPLSEQARGSLIYKSKLLFNHLPSDIKSIENGMLFRKKIKTLLVEEAYYNMKEFLVDRFNYTPD